MGGIRAAGDLVARMQMAKGMRIAEAKKTVADKLNVSVMDLTDPVIMTELREERQLGSIHPNAGDAKGIEAKMNIADLLGIKINCIERLHQRTSR